MSSNDNDIGATIQGQEPVQPVREEGPLDQTYIVSEDPDQPGCVILDDVRDEKDMMFRCPAQGTLDIDSIRQALASVPHIAHDIDINPLGEGFVALADAPSDRYVVDDAEWLYDPERLAEKSLLLAQLQAKSRAIQAFIGNNATLNFLGKMTQEDKELLARRARQLAEELRIDALSEMSRSADAASERTRSCRRETRQKLEQYIDGDIGVTQADVDALCPEER